MNPFFPGMEAEDAYHVPYDELYGQGVRGIIFDIDNTLVLPDAPADERSAALVRRLLSAGFQVCLVSNNRERRVKTFAEALGCRYVSKALKPRKYGYNAAMERMGTKPEETVSIGDQLFTDIWGANRVGCRTVLVKPMTFKEEPQIVLKRILEKPLLAAYHRKIRS